MEQMRVEQAKGSRVSKVSLLIRVVRGGHMEEGRLEVGEGLAVPAKAPKDREVPGRFRAANRAGCWSRVT